MTGNNRKARKAISAAGSDSAETAIRMWFTAGILTENRSRWRVSPERWEEVIIRCQVMDVEAREIRNEKTILIFPVTDFTDSIVVKMFLRNEQVPEVTESVKKVPS